MNKKGISLINIIIILLLISTIGYTYWKYDLEKKGSNEDKAKFCENLGYEVENEISFFYDMTCFKIEDGIKKEYVVKESVTKIWEFYNKEYYLKEVSRIGW